MAVRANWKGYLKLSLVSCAVALYPAASSSSRIRFNTLNRETGNRVKRQFVDASTGDVVEDDEQVKGYQVGKGSYVVVEDEELEAIQLESTHTIDVESFVPRDEVDLRYLDTPYYIAPDDKVAQEAFAVIRDAMTEKEMAGLARVVMARREHMILLEPLGKGLLGTTLRFPYEVREEKPYFEDIPDVKLPAEMRELAIHIVEKKKAHFDPTKFEDRYENAVIALVKSKQTGKPIQTPKAPQPSNVINLMDALKRSIGTERGDERRRAEPPQAGAQDQSGCREKAHSQEGQLSHGTQAEIETGLRLDDEGAARAHCEPRRAQRAERETVLRARSRARLGGRSQGRPGLARAAPSGRGGHAGITLGGEGGGARRKAPGESSRACAAKACRRVAGARRGAAATRSRAGIAPRLSRQARLCPLPRAGGPPGRRRRRPLLRAEARCTAPPLRSAARARRRAEELGRY